MLEKSQQNPWRTINEENSVADTMRFLVTNNLREVAITKDDGQLVGIITQYTIVNWLANINPTKIGELAEMSIEAFKLGFKEVVTIPETSTVLQAFLKIYSSNISGVAVNNGEGKLIGNISISDLKDIGSEADKFSKLFIEVKKFIQSRDYGKKVPNLVFVTPTKSIKELLQQFKTYGIHRVYIVQNDSVHAPVGIINSTDVVSFFEGYLPK